MHVPVLTEKNRLQSRQRNGIVGCVVRSCTLSEPHSGQQRPLGQRVAINHLSAAASVGNFSYNSSNVIPFL